MEIIQVDLFPTGSVVVTRKENGLYDVFANGRVRHPNSSAEDVMRVLGHYLHSVSDNLGQLHLQNGS